MKANQIAVVLDFETLMQDLEAQGDYQRHNFRIRYVFDFIEKNYGKIVAKVAFADWSSLRFRRYAGDLMRCGVEMIHYVRPIAIKSNTVSQLITIKAMELIQRNPSLDTFLLNGTNPELLPLLNYIRSSGRSLIYFGIEGTANSPLASRCDDIAIWGDKGLYKSERQRGEKDSIFQYIRSLVNVKGSYLDELEDDILDAMPDFTPETYGFATLLDLLKAAPGKFKIESTDEGEVIFPITYSNNFQRPDFQNIDLASLPLKEYMLQTRWFIPDSKTRDQMLTNIYNVLSSAPTKLFKSNELKYLCAEGLDLDDKAWQGTIFSLVCGYCLWEKNESGDVPLAYRKLTLHKDVTDLNSFITKYYESLFHKAYNERDDVTVESMSELMYPEDPEAHRAMFEEVMEDFQHPGKKSFSKDNGLFI